MLSTVVELQPELPPDRRPRPPENMKFKSELFSIIYSEV
ncbi:unnamed protein product, partial [Rotaria socialis]